MTTGAQVQTPTKARQWVIYMSVTLAIITYIDRVCISQAMIFIREDLNLSPEQQGMILSAFALAYALFEIPGGYWGDSLGPRRVLMRIVVWWSFFTAATGWAWNFMSMVVTRFLFGAGEAGCFPNLTKVFTTWLPADERVRAQGIMWMSARWGGAFTPLIVVQVLQWMSWRRAFELFGLLGVVWAIWFYRWFRDNPREHPEVNAAEADLIEGGRAPGANIAHGGVPWRKFIHSRQVWMLCGQYFCLSYGWYFYITWLPTYLREARGVDLNTGAALAVLPLFLGGVGSLFAGWFYPVLNGWTKSVIRSRKFMAYAGFTGATGFLILSTILDNPLYAMISMGMASFSNDLVMPGSWGACMDVGGKYAGTLSGTMNMMGNLGGAVSPYAIGWMLSNTDSNWNLTFYVAAGIYFAGSLFWMLLDPVTPLEQGE
ncbi:MAG: MFS transporter [Bryobacterales bacterium]|jgi:MFS transporter, ACS family, glucarate transporter|nr:MFS transporter [Bryobacterales bacterium]